MISAPPRAVRSDIRPDASSARGIDRGTVVAVALSVVFALLVLLQMLPGSTPLASDASRDIHPSDFVTLPVFIVGAVVTLSVVGTILVRAASRQE